MKRKNLTRAIAALCALSFVAAACGDDGGGSADTTAKAAETTAASTATTAAPATTAGGAATTAAPATTAAGAKGLLWNKGACDTAKPKYKIGITTSFENAILTLVDQVTALEASAKAFNARGGIGGHCMEIVKCDDKADVNEEAACAQKMVAAGVVATINDTTSFNPNAFVDLFTKEGIARFQISPGGPEMGSAAISFPIGVGGAGTTFTMAAACLKDNHKKLAMIHVDAPTIPQLVAALPGMLKAYGAEIVYQAPVPAGTTDYTQFILAAEKAGADCAFLPIGEEQAIQILKAADSLGSKLPYAVSWGTFGLSQVAQVGSVAGQMIFNAELPPVTSDQTRWPILKEALADLEASGDAKLKAAAIKSSPFRSWVGVMMFVRVIEDFGTPDVITKEAVMDAIKKAKDVESFGLLPKWTPTASVTKGQGAFAAISNPWYWTGKYDSTAKKFVLDKNQINIVAELGGVKDYPQPA